MKHQPLVLEPRFEDLAEHLRGRNFREVAAALRARIGSILQRWRAQSLKSMPGLNRFTIVEFEDSMATILNAMADAMESNDPGPLRSLLEQAPLHGVDRYLQKFTLDALLAEMGILRGSIIIELRDQMGSALHEAEAAALHELIDLAFDCSVLAFTRKRNEHQAQELQLHNTRVRRMADLGTLVAGVAHDAANLLLPLRMSVDRLGQCKIDEEAAHNVRTIELVFRHFQNTIINLRWLAEDQSHRKAVGESLDLAEVCRSFSEFARHMMPMNIDFNCEIPEGLPKVRISRATLSQVLFNLVRNGQQAILSVRDRGRITVRARAVSQEQEQWVVLEVEDDGPGMSPEVHQHCMDPFFTTRHNDSGTGLGLTLVRTLIDEVGGRVDLYPARSADDAAEPCGTVFALTLKCASPSE